MISASMPACFSVAWIAVAALMNGASASALSVTLKPSG